MIKNIPSYQDFESLGIQCITKSFEMLYAVGNRYEEFAEDTKMTEEVTKAQYWKHNEITVRTALIVLFQGIEYLMKMEIAKKSALLLIENSRTDWPTLPQKTDKDFDELQTISGENLLSVFCAVSDDEIDLSDFVSRYDDIRLKRNKLVHSTGVKDLNYQYVVKESLYFISIFYNKDHWLELFRQMFTSEPTFGYWDWDIEEAMFYKVLDFIEDTLSKGELNKYLPYNIRSRRYLCPNCTYWLNKETDEGLRPKWSFLKPNKPDSTIIECLICAKEFNTERKKCKDSSCKGNVLCSERYEEQCLTCFNED